MDKSKGFRWLVAGFAVLLLSRLVVIYGYARYWSDVALYQEAAFWGVVKGYTAYHDFWFPYPPMSLPLVYAPILVAEEICAYRHAFQWEMLLFDLGTAAYLAAFMRKRVGLPFRMIALAVSLYAAFGMLMGHLIYDRLDVVIGFVFMLSLFHFTAWRRTAAGKSKLEASRLFACFAVLIGALMKLVPLLWAPLFIIVEFFRENAPQPCSDASRDLNPHGNIDASSEESPGASSLADDLPRDSRNSGADNAIFKPATANFARALLPAAVVFALFSIAICAYDAATYNEKLGKGLLSIMSEHGARGIQMESVWAMPMMAANLASRLSGENQVFHIETVYGAQHYKNSELSHVYLAAAKFAGFAGLALIYLFITARAFRSDSYRSLLFSPEWMASAMLAVLLFVIATQRVLSPQYLLWVMPGIVVAVYAEKRFVFRRFVLYSAIFALTYVEFDIGYERLTRMDPFFVSAVFARDLLLIAAVVSALKNVFDGKATIAKKI
jgi:hypothetical protein